ncbi:DNA-directed DNA polymerase [Acidithiobacillus ferrivorans SS3]|uniref:DNA polymerase I n=1 Tax=Acidithiobacillus ferrivorans SS3 TaxID=743299 RepID=G0JLJ3_9PROT|nr:DNA polymerase [Acidithiobacillus ferrivorans]AEM48042.1 DNA-directed DNA polymerase [Acidithiobacillus ferrivorans SS3]
MGFADDLMSEFFGGRGDSSGLSDKEPQNSASQVSPVCAQSLPRTRQTEQTESLQQSSLIADLLSIVPSSPTNPSPSPRTTDCLQVAVPTNFLSALDLTAKQSILSVDEICIDVETSVKGTPWSPAEAPGKASKLGTGQTIGQYLKAHGAALDVRPRMRILSIGAGGWRGAFDLDKMDESDKAELLSLLDGKVWTGHNLAFDMLWIKHSAPHVNPKMLLDTMFLATAFRPDIERMIHARIAAVTVGGQAPVRLAGKNAGTVEQELQKMLIERAAKKTKAGDSDSKSAYSLAMLSLHFMNEKMDKAFQNSTNWMPSTLTKSHLDYCIGDITAPAIIARRMLNLPDTTSISTVITLLNDTRLPGTWAYRECFEPAARRLVDVTLRGIPLSLERVREYGSVLQKNAEIALEKVLTLAPSLAPFREILASASGGLTNDLKEAIADTLYARTKVPVERSDSGALMLDAKYLAERYPDEPFLAARKDLDTALKQHKSIDDYAVYAQSDSRVHGTLTVGAVTGRTRSSNPNVQNPSRDKAFRACFAASQWHKILAIDYSAVELRIAAALGSRAYKQFRIMLSNPSKSKAWWILKRQDILSYIHGKKEIPAHWPLQKPDFQAEPKPAMSEYANYYASSIACICRDLRARGGLTGSFETDKLTFRDAFIANVDPHILTAVTMESMAGRFDTGGLDAMAYLLSLSKADAKALKKQLAGPRQAAKACNFGLTYGMSAGGLYHYGIASYGLTWTLEEAVEARDAWFSLYPEIALWHWITAHNGGKIKADIFDTHRNEIKLSQDGGRFYHSTTLSGRKVEGMELRDALSYSDQGTGAEIALFAIARLPADISPMLVGFVHDELIFEVPEKCVEDVTERVKTIMNKAANAYLKLQSVPSECEAEIGDSWVH